MRKKTIAIVVGILALVTIISAVVAHEQEDILAIQEAEFSQVAANAAANSNAPRSHMPCVEGYAGEFPCNNVDLLSYIPTADLGGTFVNDMWGWTDPQTGTDYALVGMMEGMAAVDISDPKRPEVLGILPTASTAGGDFWRDIKVYAGHAFIVSENIGHGMQVMDLSQLRDVDASGGPVVFAETAYYDGGGAVGGSHNIAINEDTGYAYIVGSDDCSGGLHMVDISDPVAPSFAGCFSDHGYTHDTQCVVYHGPDAEYYGREICFSANTNFQAAPFPENFVGTLSIVDVTDKANPVPLSNSEYPGDGYSHQGWLTDDQATFLHGDELDELFYGNPTRTRIWDVSDLENPTIAGVYDGATASIDHNIYIDGRYAFASNYSSGLRVLDISDVASGNLSEVAYFDVYPESDAANFNGTWSNYPYFSQKGVVAITSMDRGLFLVQPRLSRAGQ